MLPHKKIRILVVDDELSIRESLSGWLKRGGYQVDTAADGLAALARSQENYYDIMLIDVKMPEMDGLSLLKKLKETESETAILMMTAYGDTHDAVEAIKLGAYDYLLKPFDLEELNLTLEKLVQMQNLAMENLILKERLATITRFENLVSQSPVMVKLFETIVDVARTDATVFITGETGTGKELVAQAIMRRAPGVMPPLSPSTVGPLRNISWKASSSDTKKGPSLTPSTLKKAGWKWPTPGLSSSMK